MKCPVSSLFFFFNDTATTEIYTLSLHDALPIYPQSAQRPCRSSCRCAEPFCNRSEEHTSELQSHSFISYAVFCLKKNSTHHGGVPEIVRRRIHCCTVSRPAL